MKIIRETQRSRKRQTIVGVTATLVVSSVVAAALTLSDFDSIQVANPSGTSQLWGSTQAAVVGSSNTLHWAYRSLVVGGANTVKKELNAPGSVGAYNLASGNGNLIEGDFCGAIGRNLTVKNDFNSGTKASVVVGQYNDYAAFNGEDVAFAVGVGFDGKDGTTPNGTVSGDEDGNGIIVTYDGDVIIPKEQGDIAMGDFGN